VLVRLPSPDTRLTQREKRTCLTWLKQLQNDAEYSSAALGGVLLSIGIRNAQFWAGDVAEQAVALGEPTRVSRDVIGS
jgi:hypothetical protein